MTTTFAAAIMHFGTSAMFGNLNLVHWDLFGIWVLVLGIFGIFFEHLSLLTQLSALIT